MANSASDLYRVAQGIWDNKRQNHPAQRLADAVGQFFSMYGGLQNQAAQAKQADISNFASLVNAAGALQNQEYQNNLNQQAIANGYMQPYEANPNYFLDALMQTFNVKNHAGNNNLQKPESAAELIAAAESLYSPQSKIGNIIDGKTTRPATKVSLGKGGAVFDFSDKEKDPLDEEYKRAQIDYLKSGAAARKAQEQKTLSHSAADKSYQNAVKIRDSYQKIAGSDKYNEETRRQAMSLMEDVNAQLAEYLSGERDTFDIQPYSVREVEVEVPGRFWGTNKEKQFRFVPLSGSGQKASDPLGLF